MNFDEHRPFRWRPEHKLIHAQMLSHYAPGCVPETRGLAGELERSGKSRLRVHLQHLFPSGLIIKSALGYASLEHNRTDHSERLLAQIEGGDANLAPPAAPTEEDYIVQRKLDLADEYRVHTIEDRVIEDLTLRRFHPGNIPVERDGPNRLVQSVLDRLPNAAVPGVVAGWDIGKTRTGEFWVIEVNYIGVHPVFEPGFHCSGFFLHRSWRASLIARLLRGIERFYAAHVEVTPDEPADSELYLLYERIDRWQKLLDISHRIVELSSLLKNRSGIAKPDWNAMARASQPQGGMPARVAIGSGSW